MRSTRQKIAHFRSRYPESLQWSRGARSVLRQKVDSLYRECQEFATSQIRKIVDESFFSLSKDVSRHAALDVFSEAERHEPALPVPIAAESPLASRPEDKVIRRR